MSVRYVNVYVRGGRASLGALHETREAADRRMRAGLLRRPVYRLAVRMKHPQVSDTLAACAAIIADFPKTLAHLAKYEDQT